MQPLNIVEGEQFMDGDSTERLMDILLQMRINLARVMETFQQQTFEMQQQLVVIFEGEKKALAELLDGIDKKLVECAAYVEDYKRLYASLGAMRERLIQLGADGGPMPEPLPAAETEGVVSWRLQELRNRGRL